MAGEALLALKDSVDGFVARRGRGCQLAIEAHFGTAVAGPSAPPARSATT